MKIWRDVGEAVQEAFDDQFCRDVVRHATIEPSVTTYGMNGMNVTVRWPLNLNPGT